MKMYNIEDVEGFLKVVDACKGDVVLVSPKGDHLNLKSKLAQFIAAEKLFNAADAPIPEIEIHCSNAVDYSNFVRYMVNGTGIRRTA